MPELNRENFHCFGHLFNSLLMDGFMICKGNSYLPRTFASNLIWLTTMPSVRRPEPLKPRRQSLAVRIVLGPLRKMNA
jgi:hypothetical protein